MFQKFNANTLISKFIKAFLAYNYIPTISTVESNSKHFYLKHNEIYFGENRRQPMNNDFKNYHGFNTNFLSSASGYDSVTHKYLGDYLRYYRDTFNIDLMPLYNCYSNIYLSDVYLKDGNITIVENNDKAITDYKIIAVPIKFNKKYTIAIDCLSEYYIYPILYSDKGLLAKETESAFGGSYKKVRSTFKSPYLYESQVTPSGQDKPDYTPFEKYMYLVIQLPVNNNTSVVVLEGDYTNNAYANSPKIIKDVLYTDGKDYSNNPPTIGGSYGPISELSLLKFSDGNSYPFSDRLVEYLLLNVITSNEQISNNVDLILNAIQSYKFNKNVSAKPFESTQKYWTDDLKQYLLDTALDYSNLNNKYDLLGYVDKDIEYMVIGG